MNNISCQSIKEIVDFINETGFKTDENLFERLNSDELLNIYINCLIYLKVVNSYLDFELNSQEENLFATVVRDNRALKIMKVTGLINYVFQKFGYIPDFSPVYIFSPTLNFTQSTLMKFFDINKKIKDYIGKFKVLFYNYDTAVKTHKNIIPLLEEAKIKNNNFISALDEGNKLASEININIEKYTKKYEELSPLIISNKENLKKLNEEYNKKKNRKENLSKQIEEKILNLEKIKEKIVPEPEKFNKIIEENKSKLNSIDTQQNNLKKELDFLNKNNEIFLKIIEKLKNIKINLDKYYDFDMKNKASNEKKEQNQKNIKDLEKELIEIKEKYIKNSEILKSSELLVKKQQKDFNYLKNLLNSEIKDNNKIKKDLIITLEHIDDELYKYQSEIDKIFKEKNDLAKIRDEFADILGIKFRSISENQNIYYKILDKSLELYQNYNLFENKDV